MEEGGKSFEAALQNAWLRLTRVLAGDARSSEPKARRPSEPNESNFHRRNVNYRMKLLQSHKKWRGKVEVIVVVIDVMMMICCGMEIGEDG